LTERKEGVLEGYIDGNDFIAKKLALWGNVAIGYRVFEDENGKPICEGQPEQFELIDKYMNKGPQAWVELPKETVAKYMQGMPYRIFNDQYQVATNEEFPAVVYLSAEETELSTDLYVAIKEYAETEKIPFVDFHTPLKDEFNGLPQIHAADGVHPNLQCYKIMEEIVLKYIK
jgi:hypothetical protein